MKCIQSEKSTEEKQKAQRKLHEMRKAHSVSPSPFARLLSYIDNNSYRFSLFTCVSQFSFLCLSHIYIIVLVDHNPLLRITISIYQHHGDARDSHVTAPSHAK